MVTDICFTITSFVLKLRFQDHYTAGEFPPCVSSQAITNQCSGLFYLLVVHKG